MDAADRVLVDPAPSRETRHLTKPVAAELYSAATPIDGEDKEWRGNANRCTQKGGNHAGNGAARGDLHPPLHRRRLRRHPRPPRLDGGADRRPIRLAAGLPARPILPPHPRPSHAHGRTRPRRSALPVSHRTLRHLKPAGRLFMQLLGAFAEFEREVIIDRVMGDMERKAAKGEWTHGPRPYGYVVDPERRVPSGLPARARPQPRVTDRHQ